MMETLYAKDNNEQKFSSLNTPVPKQTADSALSILHNLRKILFWGNLYYTICFFMKLQDYILTYL